LLANVADFPRDLCGCSLRPSRLKAFTATDAKDVAKRAKEPDRIGLPGPTRDRGHQKDFISILKGVCIPAQKPNVFLVHVHIQEAANLPCLIAQMRLEVRELLVEHGEEFS
jgi:hypothetical protein